MSMIEGHLDAQVDWIGLLRRRGAVSASQPISATEPKHGVASGVVRQCYNNNSR